MAVIGVKIPDSEYKYAKQFAKIKGVNLSSYLRDLLEEKIEEFEDERMVEELERDMAEHPEDYENGIPFSEFSKNFEKECKQTTNERNKEKCQIIK